MAVGGCVAAAAVYAILRAQPSPGVVSSAGAQPAAAGISQPAPTQPAPPRDHSVHLRLTAHPESARFQIDGAPVASNPYEADVPADGAVHQIAVVADGFETRTIPAAFDRDVLLDIALAAATPARQDRTTSGPARAPSPPPAPFRSRRAIEEEDPYKK
jgi:hypothetical protein